MNKIKSLNPYQKIILALMAGMILVFTVIYALASQDDGYLYKGQLFLAEVSPLHTVYTGKIQGIPATFTHLQDNTLVFQHGEKRYGPYRLLEDETAIPSDMPGERTGLELRLGEEILFRGVMTQASPARMLVNQDGSYGDPAITYTSNGVEYDQNGQAIDPMEPSIYTIIDLMTAPNLTHRTDWESWGYAVLLCLFNAITMFFADEIFRFSLMFQVRHPESAEASDWEMASRYFSWTVVPIGALLIFLAGIL